MLTRIRSTLTRWRRRLSRAEWSARRLPAGAGARGDHDPGLLLLQIDGLSQEQFQRALAQGRLPFLRRLLKRGGYREHRFYPGLPSSTPAVQAELHYGVRSAVPAFSFLDRRAGGMRVMMAPEAAKAIEADLAAQAEGLLRDGSSWSNIYTGGATQEESHFCGASIGLGDMWRTGKVWTIFTFAFLHFPSFVRILALLPVELVLGVVDAVRGIVAREESWSRELIFVLARVFVCVGLRELILRGGCIDLARGLPVIHINFLGYDEQSHRRGPDSAFAHWTLRGIDRAIKNLYRAARRSGRRDYEVWIFSDHGQMRSRSLRHEVEGGLEGLVRRHWPEQGVMDAAGPVRSQRRPSPAGMLGGPRRERRVARQGVEATLTVFEQQEFAVAAMGPVGHIYFGRQLKPDWVRRLAAALVADGVPGVLLRREDGKVDWLTPGGEYVLPDHTDMLPHEPEEARAVAEDLVRLCRNGHAGDLVVLGWGPQGQHWTFADENGAHAGPSLGETRAFALLPAHVRVPAEAGIFRPAVLREMALRKLGRLAAARAARRSGGEADPERRRLRVATYNAHSCIGMDGRVSPDRIAAVIEHCDADIVAVQELECGRARSRGEDQLACVAERLGYEAHFCPAVERGEERYGHGILARGPLRLVKRGVLPSGGRLAEPREALWVELEWAGQRVQFVGTHLGLGVAERRAQVAALLGPGWLGDLPPDALVVLAGDLNLSPGGPAYRMLAARWHDVQAHAPRHAAQRTFPSVLPLRQIDHLFVSPSIAVERVQVMRDELTALASDHLPLVADLRLPES